MTLSDPEPAPRRPLSRPRVLRAAIGLVDREGLQALTMRRLAQELGVEAMSLYHHVANKAALLDGVVETVVGDILAELERGDLPDPARDWQAAMRARVLVARSVLLQHPWAARLLETSAIGSPTVIRYFDRLLGVFVEGGFSYDLAHHALHVLGSRAIGFSQELFKPDGEQQDDQAEAMLRAMAEEFPYLVAMLAEAPHGSEGQLGWCDDQREFEFALDIILDGLERRRAAEQP